MAKYRMLRDYLINKNIISVTELKAISLVSRELFLLAHTEEYVDSVRDGAVNPNPLKRIGFPWSPAL